MTPIGRIRHAPATMSTGSAPELGAPLNPWFSMWTEPRRTMRQLLAGRSEGMVILVAAIGGIARGLGGASSGALGADIPFPRSLLLAILLGAICGVFFLWLTAFLVHWTGDVFDGRGSPWEVRAALAWPNVITAWTLPLCIPKFLLFRTQGAWFLCLVLVETVVAIWATVATVKCLAEAQRFSAWKALGNMLVAAMALFIPLVFLVAVLTWLLS